MAQHHQISSIIHQNPPSFSQIIHTFLQFIHKFSTNSSFLSCFTTGGNFLGAFPKDLDRYLMELLVDGRKPPELHKVAADLIAGLLQSSISGWAWIPGS